MNHHVAEDNGKPLRRLRLERREAEARRNGWIGPWPPDKPSIDSAADCERYLCRLEAGEQRAGFLTALGSNLVAFFEHLEPEHFQRFAGPLLDVAQDPRASHRTRLRAVQAAIRPLRRAVTILPKLEKAGDDSLQAHLEALLMAFCRELSADDFGRLAALLADLAGPAAKTASDKVRACEAALTAVAEAMGMLSDLTAMQRRWQPDFDLNDPEVRRGMEAAARRMAEIEAEAEAEAEEARRTGKPAWRRRRIDTDGAPTDV